MPCFPAEPPKTDSSPGGGGGFRDGLGEPGVAYVLEKKGRARALYRGKRRKLSALNDICVEWREEGTKKEEIRMERKMRSDSQLRRCRITRRVPESATTERTKTEDDELILPAGCSPICHNLPHGEQITNHRSGHSVI